MRPLLILFFLVFSFTGISQDQGIVWIKYNYGLTDYNIGKAISDHDTVNIESKIQKGDHHVGFQAGYHTSNLTKNSFVNLDSDIYLELYLRFNLSDEVHWLLAFSYWKAQIKEINTPDILIPSETINSKGLKLEVDFSLFNIYTASLLLGPSIAIENITSAAGRKLLDLRAPFRFIEFLKLDRNRNQNHTQ